MRGFLLFLLFTLLLIGGYIWYKVEHPTSTQYVKDGLNWRAVDNNATKNRLK